jgi:glycosyltransferase involved in cell wall biosynthesis
MLGKGWFPATLGGLDRYFRALLEALPEATGVAIGPAEDAPESVTVIAREDSSLPRRVLGFWQAARRRSDGVEVVDAHFALYALAPMLCGALRSKPTVFHFHGPWAEENAAAGDSSRVRLQLRRGLERLALGRADAHVVLSGAFRRVLVERYRVSPWEVHVLSPGVALERFTPGERDAVRERMGIDAGAFVVLCARRQVPRMGIDGLLDAWGRIERSLPEGSTLLLIGDGPLKARMLERTRCPPLAFRVRVMGRLSDAELIDAYRAADVAVLPSIAFEGFGLVVLEAAACGTPSIVTDVGGLPEAVLGLDRSLVIPAGDGEALDARLLGAARGALPERAATRRYAESFDWASVGERHRELYQRLAANRREPRLRVVYVDHVARLSGGEIALLRVLPHLKDVNAHVILGEDGPFADRLQQAGISVEVLPIGAATRELRKDAVRPGGPSPTALLGTASYLARLTLRLRQLRPDLVHTNSLKAGVYGTLAARAVGIPVVWHVRDRIAADYLPRPAVGLMRTMIRHLPDGVIANSSATLDTLGSPGHRAVRCVVPDSVEVSELPRASRSSEPVFGIVGRLAPWKGQDLFLRAFAEAFPSGGARAVVVGSAMFGEQSYERELAELATRLGLEARVEFRGFREDIWSELASFDVLVHASVTPEPFGQVVLEGMAAGLPVIAPDEGGPATLISDGQTGRLFRSRAVDSLAAAMVALGRDPGERERLGRSARAALAEYHPDAVAAQVSELYARLRRGDARA